MTGFDPIGANVAPKRRRSIVAKQTLPLSWNRRHSPIIEADFSLHGTKVVAALDRGARRFGEPRVMQVDDGTEFQSKV